MDSAIAPATQIEAASAPPRKRRFGGIWTWLQVVVFLAGVGLFVLIVSREGYRSLVDITTRIGWGALAVIALYGLRIVIRSVSTYIAIPKHHRAFKFRYALSARLAGDAVGFLTFTGPVLGETTKAAMLKKRVPLSHGAAAVIVENLIFFISVAVLILLGVFVTLASYEHMGLILKLTLVFSTIGAILFLAVVGMILWFRIKPLSRMTKRYARFLPDALLRKEPGINAMEGNVYEFYSTRPLTFASIFGFSMVTHLLSVIEIYMIIAMLEYVPKVNAAFIAEALTKVVNFAFGLVPAGVGVYEGGNGMIFKRLGYTVALGVAIALVRRIGILFWTAVGLIVLASRMVSDAVRKHYKRADVSTTA